MIKTMLYDSMTAISREVIQLNRRTKHEAMMTIGKEGMIVSVAPAGSAERIQIYIGANSERKEAEKCLEIIEALQEDRNDD